MKTMKIFMVAVLVIFSVLAVFAVTPSHGQTEVDYEDSVVLTCQRGDGPGEFFEELGAGTISSPRSFGMDAAGRFYIPFVGMRENIKVNIFDSNGRFIKALNLAEKSAGGVYGIVINPTGEMYMVISFSTRKGSVNVIYKYSADGQLMYKVGPGGNIESDEEGFISIYRILSNKEGDIFLEGRPGEKLDRKQYILNKGGELSMIDTYPSEIVDIIKIHEQKLKKLYSDKFKSYALKPQEGIGLVTTQIGPDGHFYYMTLNNWKGSEEGVLYHQELQIHKVIFLK